ncbi:uncharacterized protein VP01_547g3 [Puccinia sorghi]|uniref:Uncharacterized protein n=1 Tax=Puccinia sorghi TaxID=27349 RepID=A0A0L6UJH6_9BASI|nr:uncharacterized protein VP01_547g3 [Puccinia sorghi]
MTVCRDFHRMLFSDIEKQCHISRYYNGWLYYFVFRAFLRLFLFKFPFLLSGDFTLLVSITAP